MTNETRYPGVYCHLPGVCVDNRFAIGARVDEALHANGVTGRHRDEVTHDLARAANATETLAIARTYVTITIEE